MMTSDKNVGRKFNIKKTSALRRIALLMRDDYHRCAGAGALIKNTALPGGFQGDFTSRCCVFRVYHENRGTGKEQRGIHQLFITSSLKEEHDVQGEQFENRTPKSAGLSDRGMF